MRGVSSEQVKRGLNECVVRRLEWPPSAPEFRALCTGEGEVTWEHKAQCKSVHEIMADTYGLPDMAKQERAKAAGEKALSDIKNLFGLNRSSAP